MQAMLSTPAQMEAAPRYGGVRQETAIGHDRIVQGIAPDLQQRDHQKNPARPVVDNHSGKHLRQIPDTKIDGGDPDSNQDYEKHDHLHNVGPQ
jgi:hypothetical protein